MDIRFALLTGLLVLCFECAATEASTPVPKPAAEALVAASRHVEGVYQKESEAAVTPELERALAKKLLGDAKAETNAASKFAILQKCRSLAISSGDLTLAMQTLQETERSFAVDIAAIHEEVVQGLAKSAKTPLDHYLLARYIHRATDSLQSRQQWDGAKALAAHGLEAATKSRDSDCLSQWKRRNEDLERCLVAWQKTQAAIVTLEKHPLDPEANRIVGSFRCLYANDWETGLPMLAISDATTWQPLAEQELQPNPSAEAQFELADGWYDAAQKADGLTRRALLKWSARHCRSALPQLAGLARRRAESRLAEIDQATSPFATGEWVEVLDLPRLTEKVHHGAWEEVGLTLVSGDGSAILEVPAPVDRPYELRIQVQDFRKELQLYPLPDPYTTQLVINGWQGEHTQLYGLKGSYEDHSTRVKGFKPAPGVTTFDLRVEHQDTRRKLKLQVNSRPYFTWSGPLESLRAPLNPGTSPPQTRKDLVLVTAGTPTTFLSVRLKQSKAMAE